MQDNNTQQEMTVAMLPEKYKPLGAWAYFGYSLLFSIPLVGFILLIIFSCSNDNINRRNFARSYWCVLALWTILVVLIVVLVTAGVITTAAFNINS